MSRNGSGIYSLPTVYKAETGDLIVADQHNSPLEDIRDDLNAARPIVAGGTGATTASGARTALSVPSISDVQTGYVPKVASKAALSALDTSSFKAAVVTEATREKLWMWKTGDFTDAEAADTDNVNYIAADGVATSLGCWVAATGDGVTVRTIAAGGTGASTASEALDNLGGMASATYDPNAVGGDAFDMANMVEGADAKIMTAAERTKLGHITVAADIDLGDAVLDTATDASTFGFGIDEDDMASDSATKFPYQANVKAFVEAYAGPSAAWDSATAYVAGDKVSYNGAIWQANAPNTNAEPGVATEWDEFIPPFVGGTLTDPLVLAASTASKAGLVLTAGVNPTTPAEGEVWRVGTGLFIRIAGTTYVIPATGLANNWGSIQKFSGGLKRKTGSLVLANGVNVGPTLPNEPFVRISGPTAAFSIASLSGAFDGQDVELYNTTAQVMTIKHQDSTDETNVFKRIVCPGGADITATVVRLHYDEVASRWIVTSYR